MPRIETNYYCDICDKKFGSKEKAISCEERHVKAISIKKEIYDSSSDNKSIYPFTLLVEMSDGKSINYYRK